MKHYALIGEKLSHSLSPELHKSLLDHLGIAGDFKLIELTPSEAAHASDLLRTGELNGLAITIPYKELVMGQMDQNSVRATKIGSVNTVMMKNGQLCGYNTDYLGFGALLDRNGIDVKGETAVVLGAGGSAKAVIYSLHERGAGNVFVVSRKAGTSGCEKYCGAKVVSYAEAETLGGKVLVNTTPVGMYPETGVSPVKKSVIERFDTLVDLIYNPKETEFLRIGRALGKKTCNGLYMLVSVVVKTEEVWQERKIPDEVIGLLYQRYENQFA